MDTLRYKDLTNQTQAQHFVIPAGMQPVTVEVIERPDQVELVIAGNTIILTLLGARNLALRLRRAADNVDRNGRRSKTRRGKR